MYSSRGDLTPYGARRHSSRVLLVLGRDEFSLKWSTIRRHLPGLYAILRRKLRHQGRDSDRPFDLLPVLPSKVDLPRHALASDIIGCAQMIIEQVHEYETSAVATVLFRGLNQKASLHGLHNLVVQYAVIGKLLDHNVLGCGKELFHTFSAFFLENCYRIVRELQLPEILDFIHALERTKQSMRAVLASLVAILDPRALDELSYLEGRPTSLGSFITPRTMHRLREMIHSQMYDTRMRKRHCLPGYRPGSEVAIRPGALNKRHSSGNGMEIIPRLCGSALMPGDAYSSAALHEIVEMHPERILVEEPYGTHRHRPHRHRHGRGYPPLPSAYTPSFDDGYAYNDSEFDQDVYSPYQYDYDDDPYGEVAVPRHMLTEYDYLEDYEDLYDVYDDVVECPRRGHYLV